LEDADIATRRETIEEGILINRHSINVVDENLGYIKTG